MDFRKQAQKATTLAEIMEGKEKGDTQQLIDYGKKVTLNNFEPVVLANEDGEAEEVFAFTVKEFPHYFFFAGHIMRKILADWVKAYGNYEDCIEDYKKCDPVELKFSTGKTKAKRQVTLVEVI